MSDLAPLLPARRYDPCGFPLDKPPIRVVVPAFTVESYKDCDSEGFRLQATEK